MTEHDALEQKKRSIGEDLLKCLIKAKETRPPLTEKEREEIRALGQSRDFGQSRALKQLEKPELLPEYEWSIEELVHYRCTSCAGWWTVGNGKLNRKCYCPHCGRHLTPAQYPDAPNRPSSPPQELPL